MEVLQGLSSLDVSTPALQPPQPPQPPQQLPAPPEFDWASPPPPLLPALTEGEWAVTTATAERLAAEIAATEGEAAVDT